MGKKPSRKKTTHRRQYSEDLKAEAVQMLFDGHSAELVVKNLGINGTILLYRWKYDLLEKSGPDATAPEYRA